MDDNYKHPIDEKKVKFKRNPTAGSKKDNIIWILTITITSFVVSVILSVGSSDILKDANIFTAFFVIFIIVFVNIIFDIIGIAVTAADETPFHAMASRKMYGAKRAIRLIRNADKVSNFCNDVIGDICGIISGSAGAFIVFSTIGSRKEISIAGLVITGVITAFTVGGKAMSKTLAIRNSSFIVYKVSVIIQFITIKFYFIKKRRKNRNGRDKKIE